MGLSVNDVCDRLRLPGAEVLEENMVGGTLDARRTSVCF